MRRSDCTHLTDDFNVSAFNASIIKTGCPKLGLIFAQLVQRRLGRVRVVYFLKKTMFFYNDIVYLYASRFYTSRFFSDVKYV